MRPWLVWIAVPVFILFAPLAALAGPAISFDSEEHDFGPVKKGAVLVHEFGFRNAGNEILVIKGVLPT